MLVDSSSHYDFIPLSTTAALYLPFGVQYHGREHFQFAAEVAIVRLLYNSDMFEHDLFPWPCFRFGWHF